MNKPTLLVTGAGGYIGCVLVPRLLDNGWRVIAVDRYFFGQDLLPEHPDLEKVRQDTRSLSPGLFADVHGVIDLAALSNDPMGDAFTDETWAINHRARARTARLAREAGAARYVIPSSCSIYGFAPPTTILDEASTPNPLTVYAKANLAAEGDILPLAGADFVVTILRFATLFGASPRMRFDLAINGMTEGAWRTRRLPLMRDGNQWRPMIHVRDAARALEFAMTADPHAVNGRILNAGSDDLNVQIGPLGREVASLIPGGAEIEWYGDPDARSYRVSFARIAALGYRTTVSITEGVAEIVAGLESKRLARRADTITLDWYRALEEWKTRIHQVELEGAILKA
ncbi:MAG: NAD-dependent dehydratase [Bradyrhizobiaceae bacterium]|nr:MAG: NAD-dependent dehydratase [Bradyrhizobiaceae bacterium]